MDRHAHVDPRRRAAAAQRDRRRAVGCGQPLRQPGRLPLTIVFGGLLAWALRPPSTGPCCDAVWRADTPRLPRAEHRRLLGRRRREVAPDPLRPLPVRGAVAAARDHCDAARGARRRAASAASGGRWLGLAVGRRARGLLRADGRRRVRPRPGRHRPLGRPAADGDADAVGIALGPARRAGGARRGAPSCRRSARWHRSTSS